MAKVTENKTMLNNIKIMKCWLKPFSLDLKPFESVFKMSKSSHFINLFVILMYASVSILIVVGVWFEGRELSVPELTELAAYCSKHLSLKFPTLFRNFSFSLSSQRFQNCVFPYISRNG